MNDVDVTDVTRNFTGEEWEKLKAVGGHTYVYQRRDFLSGRGGRDGGRSGRTNRGGGRGGGRSNHDRSQANDDRAKRCGCYYNRFCRVWCFQRILDHCFYVILFRRTRRAEWWTLWSTSCDLTPTPNAWDSASCVGASECICDSINQQTSRRYGNSATW